MGLDLGVKQRRIMYARKHGKLEKIRQSLPGMVSELADNAKVAVESDVIYWRKANQIYGWFNRRLNDGHGVINGVEHNIDMDILLELKEVCEQVIENPEKAPDLLPAQEGFFFGSQEYKDNYFAALHHTVIQITDLEADFALQKLAHDVRGVSLFFYASY